MRPFSALLILLLIGFCGIAFAQTNTKDASLMDSLGSEPAAVTKVAGAADTAILIANDKAYEAYDEYVKRKALKSPEFMLSMALLVFAVIICCAEIIVFLKGHMDADHIIKLIIITLIIFAVLFLIVLGYTNDQIGPALGLLGTIAGYLLGRSAKETSKEDKHPKNVKAEQ